MNKNTAVITPQALHEHWQGHRRLTRRVIEAFPQDKLFQYTVGGMRSFSEMCMELISIAIPGIQGVVTGKWLTMDQFVLKSIPVAPKTKSELLQLWDWTTDRIDMLWPQIPQGRFQQIDVAFGQYEGPGWWHIFYFMDNENHHRAQGYVYLRSLGIEPPAFYDRS